MALSRTTTRSSRHHHTWVNALLASY
jgi:alpha/beta superfamily hydrolase